MKKAIIASIIIQAIVTILIFTNTQNINIINSELKYLLSENQIHNLTARAIFVSIIPFIVSLFIISHQIENEKVTIKNENGLLVLMLGLWCTNIVINKIIVYYNNIHNDFIFFSMIIIFSNIIAITMNLIVNIFFKKNISS